MTEQLLEMQRVVRSMHGSKDTDEIMKQMRKDVSKVLLEKGETEKGKGPLGKLFWAEAKVARKEQDNLSDLQAQLLKMQIAKMVNGLYLYSAFLVFRPLKALYTTYLIHPIHTHSYTDGIGYHARCQLLISFWI